MASDEELLQAWRRGDTEAGEALFERHFDAVMRFFRNKLDEGPEELVQKTFLACVESRDRFRGDASFRTFLFAVAHNVLKNHFRSRRRRGVEIDFTAESVWGLAPSPRWSSPAGSPIRAGIPMTPITSSRCTLSRRPRRA